MRVDELTLTLGASAGAARAMPVDRRPALSLFQAGAPPRSGAQVFDAYGYLLHWTESSVLPLIAASRSVGSLGGVWLTPTAYAACMTPYDLGLNSPRDAVLVVDPRRIPDLWGPGRAAPSGTAPSLWLGGATEFFVPAPLAVSAIVDVLQVEPCGDEHR